MSRIKFNNLIGFMLAISSKSSFFTMIGGDHSVTIPVERGINRALKEPFCSYYFILKVLKRIDRRLLWIQQLASFQ